MEVNIVYKDIPSDIELSSKALTHWKTTKNNVGYAKFDTLSLDDIISIVSAVKRLDAHLNINRIGDVAFYKIGKVVY
jgi:hypothetical protein